MKLHDTWLLALEDNQRTRGISLTWWCDTVRVEMRMMMRATQDPFSLQMKRRRAWRASRRQMGRRIVETGRCQGSSAEVASHDYCRGWMRQIPLTWQRRWRFRCRGRTTGSSRWRGCASLRRRAAQNWWMSASRGQQWGYAEVRRSWGGWCRQMAAGYVSVGVAGRCASDWGCEGRVLIQSRRWRGVRHPRPPRLGPRPRIRTLDHVSLQFSSTSLTFNVLRGGVHLLLHHLLDPWSLLQRRGLRSAGAVGTPARRVLFESHRDGPGVPSRARFLFEWLKPRYSIYLTDTHCPFTDRWHTTRPLWSHVCRNTFWCHWLGRWTSGY